MNNYENFNIFAVQPIQNPIPIHECFTDLHTMVSFNSRPEPRVGGE